MTGIIEFPGDVPYKDIKDKPERILQVITNGDYMPIAEDYLRFIYGFKDIHLNQDRIIYLFNERNPIRIGQRYSGLHNLFGASPEPIFKNELGQIFPLNIRNINVLVIDDNIGCTTLSILAKMSSHNPSSLTVGFIIPPREIIIDSLERLNENIFRYVK